MPATRVKLGSSNTPGMAGFGGRADVDFDRLDQEREKAAFRNFGHAAAAIRLDAQSTLTADPLGKPSEPGHPPHTKGGKIRRAIAYWADRFGAFIGPMFSRLGTSGAAHELGGQYKGQAFDDRSYMHPATKRQASRFAGSWQGSIGQ